MNADQFIHADITLRIVGDHPHRGELCHPVGPSADSVTEYTIGGGPAYSVFLPECPHGDESCYAAKHNLLLVKASQAARELR